VTQADGLRAVRQSQEAIRKMASGLRNRWETAWPVACLPTAVTAIPAAMCVAAVRAAVRPRRPGGRVRPRGAIRFCSRSQRLVLDAGLPVRASARSRQRRASRSYPHHRHRRTHLRGALICAPLCPCSTPTSSI